MLSASFFHTTRERENFPHSLSVLLNARLNISFLSSQCFIRKYISFFLSPFGLFIIELLTFWYLMSGNKYIYFLQHFIFHFPTTTSSSSEHTHMSDSTLSPPTHTYECHFIIVGREEWFSTRLSTWNESALMFKNCLEGVTWKEVRKERSLSPSFLPLPRRE